MARPFGTKNIETPERMWEHFVSYRDWVEENPILVQDFVGKDGDEVERKRSRPLTMDGFEVWCFENDIISDLGDYFENRDSRYSDYAAICSRIKKAIRSNQIEGGMAGIYNPSITQRLNGLKESTDNETRTTITGLQVEFVGGPVKPVTSEKEAAG